jgi:protein-S-isoprenylcysteine O-methyltransferase Ste14
MENRWLLPLSVLISMAAWGVFHTWLAALSTKATARKIFGEKIDRYYRLIFIATAIMTLLPILAMVIFLPAQVLWTIPTPWFYLTILLQLLAIIGILITVLQTNAMDFLGINQLLEPGKEHEDKLVVRGFYRFVRHPMYFFSIILFWLMPMMTDLLLAWVIAGTLYFTLGSIPEEQKLVAKFGDAYRQYRKEVPWLIPGINFRKKSN